MAYGGRSSKPRVHRAWLGRAVMDTIFEEFDDGATDSDEPFGILARDGTMSLNHPCNSIGRARDCDSDAGAVQKVACTFHFDANL